MMEVTTRTLARRHRMTDHERKNPFLRCLLSLGNQKAVEFWVHSLFFLRRFDKDAFDNASLIYAQWLVLFFVDTFVDVCVHETRCAHSEYVSPCRCTLWFPKNLWCVSVRFRMEECDDEILHEQKKKKKRMLWTLHIKRRVCCEASFSFSMRAHFCSIFTS